MSVAVVFDSAGTLLNTYRVAKDICNKKLLPGIETTTLTFSSPDRVLVVLPVHSKDIMATPAEHSSPSTLSSTTSVLGSAAPGRSLLPRISAMSCMLTSGRQVSDLQECIRNVWTVCKEESVVTMNSGAIINMAQRGDRIHDHRRGLAVRWRKGDDHRPAPDGVPTFIASGDRVTKLERMADHLGIPRDRVYGVATPSVKAQIVSDLKQEYDKVVMVGDGINDLCAMRNADIAILTVQQAGDRPEELYKAADHVVKNVGEVIPIVQDLLAAPA